MGETNPRCLDIRRSEFVTVPFFSDQPVAGSAICVRGFDKYNNFKIDQLPKKDLDPVALEKFIFLDKLYKNTAGS